MISKTEMLFASDRISYRLTQVLYDWIEKEGNNLQSFIDNPIGHVDYNPYMIPNFSALTGRLTLLRQAQQLIRIITDYKMGLDNVNRGMYEYAVDTLPQTLVDRLKDWAIKRREDMAMVLRGTSSTNEAPIDDYKSLYAFDKTKFMEEFTMYNEGVEGLIIVSNYKAELADYAKQLEKPELTNPDGTVEESPIEEPKETVDTGGVERTEEA